MKLHLPKMLTAALLAAFTTVGFTLPQAQASTEYNGVTYSGYIYNIATNQSTTFHDRNFTNYYSTDGGATWLTSTAFGGAGTTYYNGTVQKTTTDGKPFWRFTFGDGESVKSTLRLTGATANVYLEAQFSPFYLGGLIAEAGDYTYAVGRQSDNKDCALTLLAEAGQKANMSIASNVHLSARNGFTVASSGTWDVASGKTLAVGRYGSGSNVDSVQNNNSITFNDGLHVDMTGGGTVDLTHTNALTVGQGTTISVGADTTLLLASNTTLGGTITSAGTVTFANATVKLTDSLNGFDSVETGHYVDHSGEEAQNGYYAGSTEYTLVDGAYTGLTSASHGGNEYTVTDGKITIGSAGDTDWTTYHLRTSGASVNVGTEKGYHAELAKVVQGADTTVDLGGATLATLEGATNGAAMKLAGTGTITTLAKTGVLDMQSGASVTVPNLNVTSDMGTYSTGAGKLVIDTVTTNNNGVIEFDSATKLGTVYMTGGNVTFGGTGLHEVTTLGLSQTGTQVSTVNVAKDATLHIVGTAVAYNRDTRMNGSFSLSHWNAANVVNVYGTLISDVVVSSCDGTGTINVFNGGRLEMRDGLNRGLNNDNAITINVANGATLAAGTTHNTEQTKNSDNMVVNMATGSIFEAYYGDGDTAIINKTLTFDGGISSINTGAATGKTMTLNSNLSTDANILVYGAGELELAGRGNVLGHAIALYSGTLSMTGNFNIDALQVENEQVNWVRTDGIAEGSGFKQTTGTITVVTMEDATLNVEDATVTREGATVELADTGIVTLADANYATLWVNGTGDVSYNVAQTLAGEVNVDTVHLNYEGATVTMDKAGAAVDIVVTDGVNAGVKATQNTTINSITGLSADKTITISGGGTVSLSQDPVITASNVAVNGGHLELGGARHMITLSVTNGTVTTTHSGGNPCISGTLTINEGGVFTVAGTNQDAFGYTGGDTSNMDIYLAGADGNHAVLALNQQTQSTVTMSANLHFGGYADVTSTSTGFNTFGGQISVTGVDNTITNMQLRKAVTVTVEEDGVLTINNMTRFGGFSDGLTKEGAGKLVFDGTNVLDKTIQVNGGSLVLNGTYSIGGIEDVASSTYVGGAVDGNGFATTTLTKSLYALANGATGSIGDGAVIKIGDTDVTESVKNGAYSTTSTDNTVFYVNQETEKVSKAKEGAEMQNIVLAANTGLTVDDNFESAHISVASGTANVEISKDKVLTGTAQNMVLSGEGTYALNTNTVALGTGVTLGDDWAGIVRITDASANGLNFSSLVHGGSTLELKGFSGYPTNWYEDVGIITENIKLTNGSNGYAFKFTGNTKNENHAAVFTGKLSGDGTMQTAGNRLGFTFTGDVEDWTGKIQVLSGMPILTFGGSATKVNAAIDRNGNTVALVVDNAATFSAAVDVTSATLNGAATFAADSTLGAVTIANGGGLAVGEDATVNTTSITASGETTTMSGAGTLVLNQAVNLTAGTLTMSGVYNVDAFEYQGESTIEGGEHDGNGFATEKGSLTVVTVTEGATLVADAASVVRGGNTFNLENDGTVNLNSANYATFYVTNLSETVTKAKSKEEESHVTLTSIHVDNGAALDVDQNIDLSLVTAETGAKLNILSGQTVSVGDATTVATIAGEGTYALKSGSNTMTGTLAEGSDWTGTVRLSDVSINNINLNNYGHEGSKVEFNGVTGYFLQSNTTVFAPKLVLEGEGLKLNDGYSTLASGNPKPPTKYTFAGGVSGDGDMTFDHKNKQGTPPNVTQHLYFTGDVAGWTGSLNVVYGFTVYAQYSGEQTVNSIISRTGGTLNVEVGTGDDASVVTYTKAITSNSLTVNAGATANINGGLTTNTITVGDGATLAINGNTTLTSAITSAGTVTLTDVALSDAFEAQEGGEGQYFVESTANYYLGTAYEYLDVVTGTGAANATGTGLTWGGQEALTMAAGQVKVSDHGTASYDTLYIGQDTTTAQIAQYENIESLTNIVVKNGKLTVAEGDLQQPVDISVSEHGTISGDVTPTEVTIGSGAIAEFTKPVETEAIRFTADEGETVKVTNNGDSAAAYSMLNTQQTVEAKTLELLVAEMVMVANDVAVDEIVNEQAGGVLSLTNAESVELKSMTIGEGAIVQMTYTDEDQGTQEGTVTITESLVAGGGTLYANLTLVGHELGDETPNLLYWDLNGAGENALTLGSTLTLETESGLIQLDNDTMKAIAALETRGDYLELVVGAAGTELEYIGDGWFDGVFSRTYTNADGEQTQLGGDYNVQLLGNGNFGIVKFSDVPEPTTGTLSLLALAALAARRRKH